MNKIIADATLRTALYGGVVRMNIPNWKEVLDAAESSPAFQIYRNEVEKVRQTIDALIKEGNPKLLLSKLPKGDPLN